MATEREERGTEAQEAIREEVASETTVSTERPPRRTVQPEGVMAADEEGGGPVSEEEFPWGKVIKWALTIAGITAILYLIFRRRD